jgi:hypothetical protein
MLGKIGASARRGAGRMGSSAVVSSNAIAVVSVVFSGLVGLGGLTVAVWGARRDRHHDRTVRWEQRRQERLERAYVAVLEYVDKRIESEAAKNPTLRGAAPELPAVDPNEITRARALAAAHAGAEVRALLDEFFAALKEIERAKAERAAIDPARDRGSPATEARTTRYAELGAFTEGGGGVDKLRSIEERLHDQVRIDFDGQRAP